MVGQLQPHPPGDYYLQTQANISVPKPAPLPQGCIEESVNNKRCFLKHKTLSAVQSHKVVTAFHVDSFCSFIRTFFSKDMKMEKPNLSFTPMVEQILWTSSREVVEESATRHSCVPSINVTWRSRGFLSQTAWKQRVNPCAAKSVYIYSQGLFRLNKMPLKCVTYFVEDAQLFT